MDWSTIDKAYMSWNEFDTIRLSCQCQCRCRLNKCVDCIPYTKCLEKHLNTTIKLTKKLCKNIQPDHPDYLDIQHLRDNVNEAIKYSMPGIPLV